LKFNLQPKWRHNTCFPASAGRFCPPTPLSPMVVAFHRFSGSRLFATAALDTLHDVPAHVGRSVAPPGLVHILAMSSHPLPVQPVSSGSDNSPGAGRCSHGVVGL